MTEAQARKLERLRSRYSVRVTEEYPDGGLHIVATDADGSERDLDIEMDGSHSKTKGA